MYSLAPAPLQESLGPTPGTRALKTKKVRRVPHLAHLVLARVGLGSLCVERLNEGPRRRICVWVLGYQGEKLNLDFGRVHGHPKLKKYGGCPTLAHLVLATVGLGSL